MLRSDSPRCPACGADRGDTICARCGLEPFPSLPSDVDDAQHPDRGAGYAALAATASAAVALGIFAGQLGVALGGVAGIVAAPLIHFGLALDDARLRRAVGRRAAVRVLRPGDARIRGRVRVLAGVAPDVAMVRSPHEIRSGRFEIVGEDGVAILCDDSDVELTMAGLGGLRGTLELHDGDQVVATGRVRTIRDRGHAYRAAATRPAFDGSLVAPIRIHLEARARRALCSVP